MTILTLPQDILRLVALSLAVPDSSSSSASPAKDLLALALTCKHLCAVAYPVLWNHVHLEDPAIFTVCNNVPSFSQDVTCNTDIDLWAYRWVQIQYDSETAPGNAGAPTLAHGSTQRSTSSTTGAASAASQGPRVSYVTPVVSNSYTQLDLTRPIYTGISDNKKSLLAALYPTSLTNKSSWPGQRTSVNRTVFHGDRISSSQLETSAPPESVDEPRYVCNGRKFLKLFYDRKLTKWCTDSICSLTLPLGGYSHSMFPVAGGDETLGPLPSFTRLRNVYVSDTLGVQTHNGQGEGAEDEDDDDTFDFTRATAERTLYRVEQLRVARFLGECLRGNLQTHGAGIDLFNTGGDTLGWLWGEPGVLSKVRTLNISVPFHDLAVSRTPNTSLAAWVLNVAFREMSSLETLSLCDAYYDITPIHGDVTMNDQHHNLTPEALSTAIAPVAAPLWSSLVHSQQGSTGAPPFARLRELSLPNSFCSFITPAMIPSSVEVLTLNTFFPQLFNSNSGATEPGSLTQLSVNVSHEQYMAILTSSYTPPSATHTPANSLETNNLLTRTQYTGPWAQGLTAVQVWVPQWVLPPSGDDEWLVDEDADMESMTSSNSTAGSFFTDGSDMDDDILEEDRLLALMLRGPPVPRRATRQSEIVLTNVLVPLLTPALVQLVVSALPARVLEVLPAHCPLLEVLVVENWDYQHGRVSSNDLTQPNIHSQNCENTLDAYVLAQWLVHGSSITPSEFSHTWPLFGENPGSSARALNRGLINLCINCASTLRFVCLPDSFQLYAITAVYMLLRSAFALNQGIGQGKNALPQILQLFVKAPGRSRRNTRGVFSPSIVAFKRRLEINWHADPGFWCMQTSHPGPMYEEMLSMLRGDIRRFGSQAEISNGFLTQVLESTTLNVRPFEEEASIKYPIFSVYENMTPSMVNSTIFHLTI
ncbi:uncharacterized protein SAPINGB_P003403 [Magnusiomyces paraingens]|uniref:F-box domain-containing protein n=1 Tax=Magnusiomyces paraingens TaxID=2606893 RepID=A0A5E8BRJ5_9ASCO|nr:uncharacterized protein SAPINGB_P003403 [Saprochaete ingens]VVT53099.1 unnamed protein product [Saprochaete ingens]